MMVISYDRCKAIIDPLNKHAMSKRRALIIIALIWVIAGLLSLPNALNAKLIYAYVLSNGSYTKVENCIVEYKYKFIYDNGLFIVQYALPLFLLTHTFAKIYQALRKQKFPHASQISGNHLRDKQKVSFYLLHFIPCVLGR